MSKDMTKEEPVTEPVAPGRARRIVSLVVAGVACLGVAGSIAIVSIQGADASAAEAQTAQEPHVQPATLTSADPAPVAAIKTEDAAVEEDTAGVDQWGVRFYDAQSDPASVVFPETMNEEELTLARTRVAQRFIIAQCMADKGFDYKFKLGWERDPEDLAQVRHDWIPRIGTDEWEALTGNRQYSDEPYSWETAGCRGLAVHETGRDDAN